MKRLLAFAAVLALVSTPALAGPAGALPVGTPVGQMEIDLGGGAGPRGLTVIYSDLATSGYYMNAGTTASYPLPVGDDIHATQGGNVTELVFGYANLGSGINWNLDLRFFANTALDGTVPPWPQGTATIATINVPALNFGGWIVTVTGLNVPVPQDFWIEGDYSGSYPNATPGSGDSTVGPLLTGNPGTIGDVGYSHDLFSQTGSVWGLTGLWADFVYAVSVPEPGMICLLAIGGLAVLRRRRA